MAIQIIMDRTGDTRHQFDAKDAAALRLAEERFEKLTRTGFHAVALGRDGEPGRLLRNFDAQVEQTLFIPQLKGG